MLQIEAIRRFYEGWEGPDYYGRWFGLWRKQYKFQTRNKHFLAINKMIPRLNYRKLKNTAIKLAPLHIFASALEYLRPDKVLSKTSTLNAYPVGGEFVIDIDAYMNYHKHRHKTEPEVICLGCLGHAADLTIKLLGRARIYVVRVCRANILSSLYAKIHHGSMELRSEIEEKET